MNGPIFFVLGLYTADAENNDVHRDVISVLSGEKSQKCQFVFKICICPSISQKNFLNLPLKIS